MEVRKNEAANIERRNFAFEVRSEKRENDTRVVRGYGAVFNSRSEDLGGFVEVIAPGAFDRALEPGVSDICALVNHDPSMVLARTTAGSLKVEADGKGLKYEFELQGQSYARDLEINLDNGNITKSSFAMIVDRDRWEELEDGTVLRTILDIRELFDVSPVTNPAYKGTDVRVAKRGLDQFNQERQTPTFDVVAARRRQLQININEAGLTGQQII